MQKNSNETRHLLVLTAYFFDFFFLVAALKLNMNLSPGTILNTQQRAHQSPNLSRNFIGIEGSSTRSLTFQLFNDDKIFKRLPNDLK